MKELRVIYKARGESLWLGTLADDGYNILFEYSQQALARGVELSPIRLPLRPRAYPDHRLDYLPLLRLPGLVYDSLPDGWGLRLMDRRMKSMGINPDTVSVLDRLAYLGDNTMGALTYEPSNAPLTGTQDLTLIALAKEVQAVLIDEDREVLGELARAGGSPGGARPKALVYYNPSSAQMSTQEGHMPNSEPWLVKFPARDDTSDSCALEALYARVAHKCGLGMAPTRFFELPGGLTAFGTQRFDRQNGQRVHVHSLAGLLHTNFQVPSLGYGEFLRATRRLTRDQRELKKALQRCVFNVVMNNRDDHAKNAAYLLNENQTWCMAPPFDLTYCPGYRGEHFMDIAGEAKRPTRAHVLKVANQGGLTDKDAGEIVDEMLDLMTVAAFQQEVGELPILKKTVTQIAKVIDVNRSLLK